MNPSRNKPVPRKARQFLSDKGINLKKLDRLLAKVRARTVEVKT